MFYTCLKIMSLLPLFGAVMNHYQFDPNSWWCSNLQIVTDVLPVSIICWKVAKILNFVGFSTCPFSSADLCLMYFEAVTQCKCTVPFLWKVLYLQYTFSFLRLFCLLKPVVFLYCLYGLFFPHYFHPVSLKLNS